MNSQSIDPIKFASDIEQLESAFGTIAKMIGSYRESLLDAKMAPELADLLTRDMQEMWLRRLFNADNDK